jgi:hypothetical protein
MSRWLSNEENCGAVLAVKKNEERLWAAKNVNTTRAMREFVNKGKGCTR